jgi:hypothetical protein
MLIRNFSTCLKKAIDSSLILKQLEDSKVANEMKNEEIRKLKYRTEILLREIERLETEKKAL